MYFYAQKTHSELEESLREKLGFEFGSFDEKIFHNGEYYLRVHEEVKAKKVVVFSVVTDPREQVFKLMFLLNALKSNNAGRVVLGMPYFPYSRQDRVDKPGAPVSAGLIAKIISAAGADRIIVCDIHNFKALGKTRRSFKNILPWEAICEKIKKEVDDSWVVVAPDEGAKKRAEAFAKNLNVKNIAYLKKHRPAAGKVEIKAISGTGVMGKKALIVDDMIDTAGTLIAAANFIKNQGAKLVTASASHGIFSGEAIKKINQSLIKKVYITNSLPQKEKSGKINVIPIDNILSEAIKKHV